MARYSQGDQWNSISWFLIEKSAMMQRPLLDMFRNPKLLIWGNSHWIVILPYGFSPRQVGLGIFKGLLFTGLPGKNAMEDASPPPSPNGKGNSSFPSERCLCGPTHSETHPLNYTKSWNFFILVNQCCGWFSFWGNGFRVHWSMFIFLGDYPSKRLGVAAVPHRLPVAWKATRPRRLLFLLLQPSCILLREVQDFCVWSHATFRWKEKNSS